LDKSSRSGFRGLGSLSCGAALLCMVQVAPVAAAQTARDDTDTVLVIGRELQTLDDVAATGGRLGLSLRDTPATIDRVDSIEILRRGFATVDEVASSLPGVISGGSPGDLGAFSMRGFTGNQITFLSNGLYVGPSNMTSRPQNAFNLQSVEVLKGPASVLYGQGAVGGAINVTRKAPQFGKPAFDLLAAAGSYGGVSLGFGGGGELSRQVGARFDLSYTSTDGFVDNSPANTLNATGSLLWKPSDSLDVLFSLDYAEDEPSPYWGTPLVPRSFASQPLDILGGADGRTVDARTRFVNYNVADSRITSRQIFPQVDLSWRPADGVTVRNLSYYFDATRKWINAESYAFNAATGLIDRDRFFVFHEQELYGNQASLAIDRPLLGLDNTLVVGVDYSHLDFTRSRGFPDGDSVDPFRPSPGLFGAIVPRLSPTQWDQTAIFFENATDLTSRLKLVLGGRYETLDLDRRNFGPTGVFQAASSFSREYESTDWRAGLVYDLNEFLTPYVSWSTGSDPVGSNIFLVNAGENFDLSDARQVEAGVKMSLPGKRGTITVAAYDIERKNILTQVGVDTVANVGSQKSRGVELSGEAALTQRWIVSGNAAYVDASYGAFFDPNFGVDASGNTPDNVPEWTVNLSTSLSEVGGLPLELGGSAQYVGERFGNSANTITLDSYATLDLYAAWSLTPSARLTARVNNATDEDYARWLDVFYPNQVMIGAPRTYELGLNLRF
jgi:iron complex outermembrane recepter protein